MRAYEVGIKGWEEGSETIFAASAGKAKYQRLRDLRECWPDLPWSRLTCRSLGDIPVPPTRTELAQREADAFNRRYPVGTLLHYWSWTKEGAPTGTAPIKHVATVVCENPVIWLAGVFGCISLSHVVRAT